MLVVTFRCDLTRCSWLNPVDRPIGLDSVTEATVTKASMTNEKVFLRVKVSIAEVLSSNQNLSMKLVSLKMKD